MLSQHIELLNSNVFDKISYYSGWSLYLIKDAEARKKKEDAKGRFLEKGVLYESFIHDPSA